jgi:hypothetical protein
VANQASPVPREHGAWGMLYVPLVLALLCERHLSWPILWLTLSATALFLARTPLQTWARFSHWQRDPAQPRRSAVLLLAAAGITALPLFVWWNFYGLLLLAAVGAAILGLNIWQSVRREERTVGGELLALGAMVLTAPAAHYVARGGEWHTLALILWTLCFAFFASGVLYVKLRIAAMHEKKPGEKARLLRACVAYHLGLLGVLLAATAQGWIHPLLAAAFAPLIFRALWPVLRGLGRVNLKRAGWLEVAWSILFLVLVSLGYPS